MRFTAPGDCTGPLAPPQPGQSVRVLRWRRKDVAAVPSPSMVSETNAEDWLLEGTAIVHSTFGTGRVVRVGLYKGARAAWVDSAVPATRQPAPKRRSAISGVRWATSGAGRTLDASRELPHVCLAPRSIWHVCGTATDGVSWSSVLAVCEDDHRRRRNAPYPTPTRVSRRATSNPARSSCARSRRRCHAATAIAPDSPWLRITTPVFRHGMRSGDTHAQNTSTRVPWWFSARGFGPTVTSSVNFTTSPPSHT